MGKRLTFCQRTILSIALFAVMAHVDSQLLMIVKLFNFSKTEEGLHVREVH